MVSRDIERFLVEHGLQKQSYQVLSDHLVASTQSCAYNFDEIAKQLFRDSTLPRSADAIFFGKNSITLIEFKRGFSQDTLRKRDFCDTTKAYCKQLKKTNDTILYDSLLLKAIESCWILEHHIAPQCSETEDMEGRPYQLRYIAVIDMVKENSPDAMEFMREGLAGTDHSDDNVFSKMKIALSRLGRESKIGQPVYFNEPPVIMSTQEFLASKYVNE